MPPKFTGVAVGDGVEVGLGVCVAVGGIGVSVMIAGWDSAAVGVGSSLPPPQAANTADITSAREASLCMPGYRNLCHTWMNYPIGDITLRDRAVYAVSQALPRKVP